VLVTALGGCGGGHDRARPPRPVHWVSLGDSYAAADGVPGRGECARSEQAFAPLADRALHDVLPVATFTHVACSGAAIDDIGGQFTEATDARPGTRYDLATLIVGGNDVGFADVLRDCVGSSDLRRGCNISTDDLRTRVNELAPRLDRLFRTVRDRLAPGGFLVVLGYPQIFEVRDRRLFRGCDGLRAEDVVTMRTVGDQLADATARVARSIDRVRFVDVRAIFAGHGRCGPDATWIHGVKVQLGKRTPLVSSFHPNEAGQQAEAQLLEQSLRGLYSD
jgi:lysophospholipase L1-like esterase